MNLGTFKIVHSEFTEREQVLVDQYVEQPSAESCIDKLSIFRPTHAQEVESCAEHE